MSATSESATAETRYSRDHEWIRREGGTMTVGITDHAQSALGDLVFVELPEVGRELEAGETCAVVESVKAASDVYAPLSGTVSAANDAVVQEPALVNRAAETEAWFFRLSGADPEAFAELMDRAAYDAFLATL